MSFTSLTFAVFCVVVLTLYWSVQRKVWQNVIMLGASFIFYGWIHPWYSILLAISTSIDFYLARSLARSQVHARNYLTISIILNLGLLAFFKYFNFFNEELAVRLNLLGINGDYFLVGLILPAGLSFYTLKKLSYVLDISRGTLIPIGSIVDYALYVVFFPQIISGPIDRPQKLLPQIELPRRWKGENLELAWPLIVMGLFKKLVIADTIKSIVDRVISLQAPSKLIVMAAALGFTLQILADFSAYTDISRGIAWLFGFDTSENFRTPYLSKTPSEFWNRWHITLSSFLRDYIFFPLRRSLLRKRRFPSWLVNALPPLVTMLVSGFWHGAGWTYLVWGLYFGLLIVTYQSFGIQGEWKLSGWFNNFLAWMLMFSLIVFGWLIFRAPSIAWLGKVLFLFSWINSSQDWVIVLVIFSMLIAYSMPLILKLFLDRRFPDFSWWHAIYYTMITVLIVIYTNSSNPDFIYFQF